MSTTVALITETEKEPAARPGLDSMLNGRPAAWLGNLDALPSGEHSLMRQKSREYGWVLSRCRQRATEPTAIRESLRAGPDPHVKFVRENLRTNGGYIGGL